MKLNKKIVVPIVFAIVISWIVNIYMFSATAMEKPLLLSSYLGLSLSEGSGFELSYISNTYDEENIISASFPEISSKSFPIDFLSEEHIQNSNYSINRVRINLDFVVLENGNRLIDTDETDPISIRKIQLGTSFGKTYEYDLGEICLFKEPLAEGNSLIFNYSNSSSGNYGSTTLKTEDDIKINEIVSPSPLSDYILEVCDIEINEKALNSIALPLSLKAGEQIEVKYKFKSSIEMKPQYRFSNYLFPIVFKGIDSKGNTLLRNVFINGNNQYGITKKDIRKLIEESR